MLRVESISAFYGAIQALRNVSVHVSAGEIVTLLGANGAGKSTLLKIISGIHIPAKGRLWFGGQNITGLPAERILHLGVGQVPEGRQIFAPLSVLDNLILGAYVRFRREEKKEVLKDLDSIFELFPVLKERTKQRAGTLSGGEQQMVAIGRTLMARPKLLLLDEPSMGLAPKVVNDIFQTIQTLRSRATTILLVEQNAKAALKVADRGYIIETGRIILEGETQDLLNNKEVQRAYLGKEYREIWE
ncbi:MAG: ABC transporter ATP-binding protein [Deltaproteobacteria bacterium]|jgi:branched-chain amino acid transport system ATP-binding protein|nr:ABC transporter ATP-binding protein [Deltaproteobacteria bacterium]